MEAGHLPEAYRAPRSDRVRDRLEAPLLAATARRLMARAPGGRVLELGCGGGLGPLIAGPQLNHYTGVDFRAPGFDLPGPLVLHDLRDGLGPVGPGAFDLYLAGFGLASHLAPAQLGRLLADIVRHARPGALVAVEALGLFSLEWPRLWNSRPGAGRVLRYELGGEVRVHPWAPAELSRMLRDAGIRPLESRDRSLQTGPKLDTGGYWPGLPPLRAAVGDLLEGRPPGPALTAPLPPLPAGSAAAVHQRLRTRRLELADRGEGDPRSLARALWALEAGSGGGFGHGLLAVGRVP